MPTPSDAAANRQVSNVLSRVYNKTKNTLRVEGIEVTLLPGDIEIGAVEIKDGLTDQRASVGSDGGLRVQELPVLEPINVFASDTGTASLFTDIVVYTVPAGKTLYLTGYIVTGEAEAKFELVDNTTVISTFRITRATMTGAIDFGKGAIKVIGAHTVTIRVRNNDLVDRTFEGQLYGYLI